ncbi:MAG: hypothetical protein H6Q71_1190 [Firmicutes bacterium]|nr:hypothetical protein [Bacillota bacterium]
MAYKHPEFTTDQLVRRMADIREVENVMAKHAYLHGLKKNAEEFDTIWCKKAPNPHFAQNQGYYIGYDLLKATYRDGCGLMTNMATQQMKKMYPELAGKSDEELYGVGTIIMHPLTTSIIELAGDGETAKGMWYSPGQITEVGPSGPEAQWIWEKYGVDFIKEDGNWKIWHMHVCTDFCVPVGTSWTDGSKDAPLGAAGGTDVDGGPQVVGMDVLPPHNKAVATYKVYSKSQVPQDVPRIPEPYWTFSETFSY